LQHTLILTATLATLGAAALGHAGATGVVKDRMDAMDSMSEAMKVIVPMTRGQLPYDGAAMAEAANVIAGLAGASLIEMFPEGTTDAPSEAAPAIWEDFDRFSGLAMELERAAGALADAAAGSDVLPEAEFGAMAATCSGCHRPFRL